MVYFLEGAIPLFFLVEHVALLFVAQAAERHAVFLLVSFAGTLVEKFFGALVVNQIPEPFSPGVELEAFRSVALSSSKKDSL